MEVCIFTWYSPGPVGFVEICFPVPPDPVTVWTIYDGTIRPDQVYL